MDKMHFNIRNFLRLSFFLLSILGLASCSSFKKSKGYFPQTGKAAIYQRSLDARNPLTVLSLALQPGFEDLQSIAYLRLGLGARVLSAYVTNGENGESDIRVEYPSYLGARRRLEADRAATFLDADVYFLNLRDVRFAGDSIRIAREWRKEKLRQKLGNLLVQFRPDIVLLAGDRQYGGKSFRWKFLKAQLLEAAKEARQGLRSKQGLSKWSVSFVFEEAPKSGEIQFPLEDTHPIWKKTYARIGGEAAKFYASLKFQRKGWKELGGGRYRILWADSLKRLSKLDEFGKKIIPARLQTLNQAILKLTSGTLRGSSRGALKRLAAIKDTINYKLTMTPNLPSLDRRILLNWKESLERLQCALQDIRVSYSISDTLLTARQLTYFRVDKLRGDHISKKVELFFAGFEKDWVFNESVRRRFSLEIGKNYRLISPTKVVYTYPPSQFPFRLQKLGIPYYFFLINYSSRKEYNFIYRIRKEFTFAPRFTAEILTPIVYAAPGERVVIKLTNFSRDAVSDTVWFENEFAVSEKKPFRLARKNASYVDTLHLQWKKRPDRRGFLVPLRIGGIPVARVAVRNFEVRVDSSRKVGVLLSFPNSPVLTVLREIGANYFVLHSPSQLRKGLKDVAVLILDHRILSIFPQTGSFRRQLDQFVKNGGELVVLAQEPFAWKAAPLWAGMELNSTQLFDEKTPVEWDTTLFLLRVPNQIGPADWANWLNGRGYQWVKGPALADAVIPVWTQKGRNPLILIWPEGKGVRIYLNLVLYPQFLNVHEGVYKLLGNIISFSRGAL